MRSGSTLNIKALTASSFASMFFLGVALAIVGAAAKDIGLSPDRIGWLISTKHLGFLVSVLISGYLADTRSKARILMVGSLILAAAFACFYASDRFWVNMIVVCFIGAGAGAYEAVTDALLLDIRDRNQSKYINVNHFFITIGMASIALYLIRLRLDWRSAMIQSSVAVGLLAAYFAFARTEVRPACAVGLYQRASALPNKLGLYMLFAVTALVVGVELGTVGILTTFLCDLRGFTLDAAKFGLVVFFAGVASGRLLIGLMADNRHIRGYLVCATALCAALFGALYFVDAGGLTMALVFFCGASISAVVPMIITLAGLACPDASATVMGFVKAAIPVGGITIPALMSVVTERKSFQTSLIVFPIAAALAIPLIIAACRKVGPTPSSSQK